MTLTLALPSKGRLKEQAAERLAAVGLPIVEAQDARKYRARIDGRDDIELVFLSASEIAREVGNGGVDLGVTGEDLLRETIPDIDARVEIAARLGFGRADVVVAVPEVWLDVETMADLDDVAAEFPPSPRTAAQDRHQILAAHPAVLLAKARHPGLPHRREPGRHRGRAGGRFGRRHRRHHHHGSHACRQPLEGARPTA